MDNMAYTREYELYRNGEEAVFCAENYRGEETMPLPFGYSLTKCSYGGRVGSYTLHASENKLLDKGNKTLYTWRNLDDSGEFCKIISHRDGNHYLVYRIELYGYSVLNLSAMQDFHYIPSGSFPKGETFIWTDVFYNGENNMLAVSGCYWACPFGILILDFSRPMREPGVWANVQECLEDGYDCYDNVDFTQWRGTELILSAYNCHTECKEILTIPESLYAKWLRD